MKTRMHVVKKVDREATAEEVFRVSRDRAICGSERNADPEIHLIDYQWFEIPEEDLIYLMAVCSSGERN
jgi:hypothetical protein